MKTRFQKIQTYFRKLERYEEIRDELERMSTEVDGIEPIHKDELIAEKAAELKTALSQATEYERDFEIASGVKYHWEDREFRKGNFSLVDPPSVYRKKFLQHLAAEICKSRWNLFFAIINPLHWVKTFLKWLMGSVYEIFRMDPERFSDKSQAILLGFILGLLAWLVDSIASLTRDIFLKLVGQ